MQLTDSILERGSDVISVLVVDDHTTFSDLLAMAISGLPGLQCVGTAGSGQEALALTERLCPDVVVMDVRLGQGSEGPDGIEATRLLTRKHPDLRVLVLTAHAERSLLRRAADAGACCLLPKDGSLDDLLDALRSARRGGFIVAPTLLRSLVASPGQAPDLAPELTRREREVLRMLAEGIDPQTIARGLGISVHTCRGYVKTLLVKLGAHSQLEAVSVARRNGLVDVPAQR